MEKKVSSFKIDEIALVLIVAFIAIIVTIYDKSNERISGDEAEKITAMILDDHEISFANGGVIDYYKLEKIQNMKYNDFKDLLKVKNDFCIYVEDGNGNIILSKGSERFNVDGLLCKE